MPYDDGRNSARARSARIRASHDHEGTQLEEMRRRTRELGDPEPRLLARLAAAIGRVRRADPSSGQVIAAETEIASGGLRSKRPENWRQRVALPCRSHSGAGARSA